MKRRSQGKGSRSEGASPYVKHKKSPYKYHEILVRWQKAVKDRDHDEAARLSRQWAHCPANACAFMYRGKNAGKSETKKPWNVAA